jgi:hypothetical protein
MGNIFCHRKTKTNYSLSQTKKNALKIGWSIVHERKLIREDLPETNLVRSQKQDSRRADR